ncbi:receptor-like protein 6 [Hevea brasiliensis]|uniref:receptor-like protein 6 n=1 Tax=Hevea brasiliensis TaxID=3981 RepID=UPI0025DB8272|nr:receptor-like protein 6 [Hevea brasiliensis]
MEFTWLSPFICLLLYFQAICSPSLPFPILCPHDQGLALLQIKKSFSTSTSASFVHHELESWKEGTDCCSWNGVECDTETGHVIGLNVSGRMLHGALNSNSTLFSLTHLQTLDLSNNDFSGSHIPSLFSHLLNLTCLNLSSSNVAGQVPSEISLLSKLVFLDLSFNENLVLETTSFTKVVQNLTKLRELSLSTVDMASVALHSLMNLSSSLSSLRLVSCALQGKFPDEIFHRSNLQLLDIEDNKDLTGSLPRFNGSSRLWFLALSFTSISVYLELDFFSSPHSLKELYLSSCNVMGSNFAFLGNLTQLTRLDLSGNNFNGQIPPSLGILEHLDFLDLSNNNFSGLFPFVVYNRDNPFPSRQLFISESTLLIRELPKGSITAILVFSAFFEVYISWE